MSFLSLLRSGNNDEEFANVNALDNVVIFFKDPDPQKGIKLEQNTIKRLDISESLFSRLPLITLYLKDSGRFFKTYNLMVGDTIHIKITPNKEIKEEETSEIEPFINSSFVIQSISKKPLLNEGVYGYEIVGIYNAENFLNEISYFPKESLSNFSIVQSKKIIASASFRNYYLTLLPSFRSDEVLDTIISETGLKFINEVKGNDSSYWLNGTETRAEFVDRILKHAWIAEDDAPLLYTDVNGNCYYTSIKTLVSNIATIKSNKSKNPKQMKFRDINVDLKKSKQKNEDVYYRFNEISVANSSGPILNDGGYKIKSYFFNPFKTAQIINQFIIKSFVSFGVAVRDLFNPLENPYLSYKTSDFKKNSTEISKKGMKRPAKFNSLSKVIDGGIKFSDHHEFYDIAEEHNKMIRKSFFQSFVKITVDTQKQPIEFNETINRPRLGSKVYLDFGGSEENSVETIHSGDYIIAKIRHVYQPGHSYSMIISLVSDGYYSEGEK